MATITPRVTATIELKLLKNANNSENKPTQTAGKKIFIPTF